MGKAWYAKPCGNWIPKQVVVIPAHRCDGTTFIPSYYSGTWGCQTCLKTIKRAPKYTPRKATP